MKSTPIPAWGVLIFGILFWTVLIQIGFINNSSLTKTYFADFKQTFDGPITNDTDALYQTNSLNYKPLN